MSKNLNETIERMKSLMLLNEDPDTVYERGNSYADITDDDAYPFGYLNGVMFIGKQGKSHYGSTNQKLTRADMKASGRLWINKKILSFWCLNGIPLATIVKDLNEALSQQGIKIDNSWSVNVARVNIMKRITPQEAERLIPLDKCISEIGNKFFTDDYMVAWTEVYRIFYDDENYRC